MNTELTPFDKAGQILEQIDTALEVTLGEITPEIDAMYAELEAIGTPVIMSVLNKRERDIMMGNALLARAKELSEQGDKYLVSAKRKEKSIQKIMEMLQIPKIEQPNGTVITLVTNAESTEVTDEALVPDNYKRYKLTVPGSEWLDVSLLLGDKAKNVKSEVDKTAVKAAWKASGGEIEIAGTKIVRTKSLRIKG